MKITMRLIFLMIPAVGLFAQTYVHNPGEASFLCFSENGRIGQRVLHYESESTQCYKIPCELEQGQLEYLFCRDTKKGTYFSSEEVAQHIGVNRLEQAPSNPRPSRVQPDVKVQVEEESVEQQRPSRIQQEDELLDSEPQSIDIGHNSREYVARLCQSQTRDQCVTPGQLVSERGLYDCRCPLGYQRSRNYTCVSQYIFGKSTQQQMIIFGARDEEELKQRRSCSAEVVGELSVHKDENIKGSINRSYVAQNCLQESDDGSSVKGSLAKIGKLWICQCPEGYQANDHFHCVASERPRRSIAWEEDPLHRCQMNVAKTLIVCPSGRYVLVEDAIFQDARQTDEILEHLQYDDEQEGHDGVWEQ